MQTRLHSHPAPGFRTIAAIHERGWSNHRSRIRRPWFARAHRYVLWSPDNRDYRLTGLTARTYQTIHVVPATLSPDGHHATFLTNTIVPVGGEFILALEDDPILVEPVPPPPFAVRAVLDGTGAPLLFWPAAVGEVIKVEVATSLLPAHWTAVPADDLEFSVAGAENLARYVGPLSPPLFFRLLWDAP